MSKSSQALGKELYAACYAMGPEAERRAVELINRGADVNYRHSFTKQTALHHACIQGKTEAEKLLLCKGASPNVVDYMGRTPSQAKAQIGKKR